MIDRVLGLNVQNIEGVLKFVRHFHTPIPARQQLAVNALEYLPGCYRGLLPRNLKSSSGPIKSEERHTPQVLSFSDAL
jgi:hypothetical protein